MANPKQTVPSFSELSGMWQASGLKEKLLFTIGFIALFRLGAQIPVWGVRPDIIKAIGGAVGNLLGMIDMFSGGALGSISILALGIGPYITASIIMQLLIVVIPRLEELQKEEGEAGRKKISQYTRYLALGLAFFQSTMLVKFLTSQPQALLPHTDPTAFWILAILTLTGGAMFSLWVAEMITDRGVGNGGSLLIFVGILTRIPLFASQTQALIDSNPAKAINLTALLGIYLITIGLIIVLQEAARKIFIVQAKRQVGNKIYGGQNTYIPFKLNPSGVMPIIFAYAIMTFFQTLIQILQQNNTVIPQNVMLFYNKYLAFGTPGSMGLELVLIVFFTFFYASIMPGMQPKEIADNLKKYGSAIPGIKPGKPTAEKLEEILSKTTFIGAMGLALIFVIAGGATHITQINTLQGLAATSLIIMVGVALDTMNQIRTHMLARQYEGFLR